MNRCFLNPYTLFTLVNPELLSLDNQMKLKPKLLEIFLYLTSNFLFAVVTNDLNSHFVNHLRYQNEISTIKVLKYQFLKQNELKDLIMKINNNITVYTSKYVGLGKSTQIHLMAKEKNMESLEINISGSLNNVTLGKLLKKSQPNESVLLHIQINYIEDPVSVHEFIFSLAVFSQYYSSKGIFYLPYGSIVCIEIANTYKNSLFESLSFLHCLNRVHIDELDLSGLIMNEKIDYVCTYLGAYETGEINLENFRFNEKKYNHFKKKEVIRLINKYFLENCSSCPTFHQLTVFFNILSQILINFENSSYSPEIILLQKMEMKGIPTIIYENLRSTIFESLLETCKEFTTTSIDSVRDNQASAFSNLENKDDLDQREAKLCKAWENSSHFSMLFIEEGSSICIYRDPSLIPKNIKEFLFIQKYLETMANKPNQSKFITNLAIKLESGQIETENYNELDCVELIERLVSFYFKFSSSNSGQLDKEKYKEKRIKELAEGGYVLTPDNFLKMNLIFIRCISNIPLIIMGETGVGKTSLIRFFVSEILQEKLEIICIHSGMAWQEVYDRISKINDLAEQQNRRI